MPLVPGARLGPYEVVAPLGAGGMGEVYRATDTRLDRSVAVKILSVAFAHDAKLKIRFEREAKAISSLSHPNICTVYDVGHESGTDYLVMEYLEGDTLADRIAKGPLPLAHAVKIGIEIVSALDSAHRQGIVHRDLKPANVMLTRSGAKLLDFGLAKVPQSAPLAGFTQAGTQQQLTAEGTILGTFQYMAPEQLEGSEADARTDIWAFGAVLFEMVTGRKAFDGKSKTSLIAAIVDRDPAPITEALPMAPPALDRIIRTCLEKDPEERWQNAHDILRELQWVAGESSESRREASSVPLFRRRGALGWLVAAAVALLAIANIVLGVWRRTPARSARPMRLSLLAAAGASGGVSISPEGTRVTFTAPGPAGRRLLWIRPLNSDVAHPLFGTENGTDPFWSPDGGQLAFFADGKLMRIDASGGTPVILCDAPRPGGGSWNARGDILFVPNLLGPVHRVAAAGGTAQPLWKLDVKRGEAAQASPQFLPDGRQFIFASFSASDRGRGVYVASLDEPAQRRILPSVNNAIYADGFILFPDRDSLMAQRFDTKRGVMTGDRVVIADHAGNEFAAGAGILILEPTGSAMRQIVWIDRAGKELEKVGDPGPISALIQLSPDGSKAAAVMEDAGNSDIWLVDLGTGARSRFTLDAAADHAPAWSPDGKQIAFSSNRNGAWDVYVKSLAAEGGERLLFKSSSNKWVKSWSPDGRFISYVDVDASGRSPAGNAKTDLWILPLSNPTKPWPYFTSDTFEDTNLFSPDGRWMAYISDETGRWEVFVSTFPKTEAKWQISTHGIAAFPQAFKWRRDGKEILYLAQDWTVMSVSLKSGKTFEASAPKRLFVVDPNPAWDVSATGERFLIAQRIAGTENVALTVVTNWTADLKQ